MINHRRLKRAIAEGIVAGLHDAPTAKKNAELLKANRELTERSRERWHWLNDSEDRRKVLNSQIIRLEKQVEELKKKLATYSKHTPDEINRGIAKMLADHRTTFEELAIERLQRARNAGWAPDAEFAYLLD